MFLQDRLNLDSKRIYTDEGFLRVPARISRSGIQEYLAVEMGLTDREPTDRIKVYRPPEEVFSEDSMSSFSSKPVTNNHPPELVNASNSKLYTVGMSDPNVTQDGDYVLAVLNITDEESIKQIEGGKSELSNGYLADIDWTPGVTPDGVNYDAVQRNIKGNHIAIVERGRAGPACRVADHSINLEGEVNMAKITIDGVDYEVSEQAAQAVGKLQASMTDTENQLKEKDKTVAEKEDEMEEEKKKAQKSVDALQAKLDDAKSKILDAQATDQMISDRMELVSKVLSLCPETNWEGKDAKALMVEVVGAKCPNIQMDSVSDEYIKARFDILSESIENNTQFNLDNAFTKQFEQTNTHNDNYMSDSQKARAKFAEDSRKAWEKKGDK